MASSFRWLCSTRFLMRSCLCILAVVYGALFLTLSFQDHGATATNSFLGGGSSKFQRDSRRSSPSKTTPSSASPLKTTSSLFPTTHGLVEGRVDYYLNNATKPLWEHSSVLPDWMKSYFSWHRRQRRFLEQHPEQWQTLYYHLVECTHKYPNCGGTADRLGSLPFHVQFAASCDPPRLLLYHWTIPAPLESFLLPPELGVDWRLPSWLRESLDDLPFPRVKKTQQQQERNGAKTSQQTNSLVYIAGGMPELMGVLEIPHDKAPLLVRAKTQSHDHGATDYNSFAFLKTAKLRHGNHTATNSINDVDFSSQPTFQQVFHDLWRVFFTPAPTIAAKIEEQMTHQTLQPGSYIAIHLRLLYGNTEMTRGQIKGWTHRMIHCVIQHLVPEFQEASSEFSPTHSAQTIIPTLLFVADAHESIRAAAEYAKLLGVPLVHRQYATDQDPLHLEKDVSRQYKGDNAADTALIEDLRDTFVDIYTIGMSRCVAYQNGGFGRWGSMMSYNASCSFFLKPSNPQVCPRPSLDNYITSGFPSLGPALPLFLPPMSSASISTTAKTYEKSANMDTTSVEASTILNNIDNVNRIARVEGTVLYKPVADGVDLWQESTSLPSWMKEYFDWHKLQRQEMLTPTKWDQMQYLVMCCRADRKDRVCGGTADRLKPIPMLLRHAAKTKRFLLIHWEVPCKLEEFLLPPKGGIDWTVPTWLLPKITHDGIEVASRFQIKKSVKKSYRTIRTVYQSSDGGLNLYNEDLQRGESRYEEVYHLVWRILFTPVPQIASRIKQFLDDNGLIPNDYAAAHLRALYDREDRKEGVLKKWTRGAVNCASNLRPNGPIFLASDSGIIRNYGPVYGNEQNGTVVVHENVPNPPLHLDRAGWNASETARPPSDYYDTFTDLYLLSLSGCLFYSKGGYGTWAMYINGNLTCSYKSKGWNKLATDCEFQGSTDKVKAPSKASNEQLFLEPIASK